jgi:hypothetical protein
VAAPPRPGAQPADDKGPEKDAARPVRRRPGDKQDQEDERDERRAPRVR